MTYATTFSGVAGWEIGLNACGWELLWQCECDDWCRALLKERFGVPIYSDIRTLADENPPKVDVLIGSPPCQPFSVAGAQRGVEDERHLYPSFIRAVGVLRPKYVLMEQVPAILSSGKGSAFGGYVGGLAALGYDLVWHSIPACAVGAPHRRDRVWIIAHARHHAGSSSDRQPCEASTAEPAGMCAGGMDAHATDPSCDPRNERRPEPERLQWQAETSNGSDTDAGNAECSQRGKVDSARRDQGQDGLSQRQESTDRAGGSGENVSNSSRLLAGWKEQWTERERVGQGSEPVGEDAANTHLLNAHQRGHGAVEVSSRPSGSTDVCASGSGRRQPESDLGGVVNGISTPLDSHHGWLSEPQIPRTEAKTPDRVNRLKSLGNAVVPQIPYLIGQAINAIERENYEH